MPIYPIPYKKSSSSSSIGADGKSAYQIWLDIGNTGTETQFIESLKGEDGAQGVAGPIGPAGLTWKGEYSSTTTYDKDDAVGYEGATYFSLDSTTGVAPLPENDHWALMAAYGERGEKGEQGESAYEVWVDAGNEGSETIFLESLVGSAGSDGKSAYEVAVANGYSGTESAWLASLKSSSSVKYFGISPTNGKFVRHPLGDSGLYYVMKGTGNYDVGDGIYDANYPRVIGYRFVALWGGSGVDGYYNQAYTTTSSDYIFDGTSYFNAQENQLCYVTDVTTGRVWRIERWGMSRTSGRYIVEITEFSDGITTTYTDYSTST